jgi:hypothetical protein
VKQVGETSRSLGSRLRRSPLAIRDRLVGKSTVTCVTRLKERIFVFLNILRLNSILPKLPNIGVRA